MALSHWKQNGNEVLVSHKETAITISLTPEDIITYDHGGRLIGSYEHGLNYRRSLDNKVQKRWRVMEGDKEHLMHKLLDPTATENIIEGYRRQLVRLLDDRSTGTAHPDTRLILEAAAAFSWERLELDAARFKLLYGHVPILPPDQYRALLIQATDGCTYNKCTFCTLYREKSFYTRPFDDFQNHLGGVLDFLGAGISYRNSIFLGDANAIAIDTQKLLKMLSMIKQYDELMSVVKMGGIHAFLDIYTGTRKSVEEYRALANAGIRRISLGVESGSEALLEFVQKPGSREDIASVVRTIKQAGINLNVILMVGLGGKDFQDRHREESLSLGRELELDRGDIIYLSRFDPSPTAPYLAHADSKSLVPLTSTELAEQTIIWQHELASVLGPRGPKIVPYSFQRFLY
ncbi:radical SAM protein [Candidatus Neomarinimicrobiota bacterium]